MMSAGFTRYVFWHCHFLVPKIIVLEVKKGNRRLVKMFWYILSRYRLGSHCVGSDCHVKGLVPIVSAQTVTAKAWFPLCRYRLSRYRLGSHCVGTDCHGKGLVPIVSVQTVTVQALFPLCRYRLSR